MSDPLILGSIAGLMAKTRVKQGKPYVDSFAHDIKNPISSITGTVETLAGDLHRLRNNVQTGEKENSIKMIDNMSNFTNLFAAKTYQLTKIIESLLKQLAGTSPIKNKTLSGIKDMVSDFFSSTESDTGIKLNWHYDLDNEDNLVRVNTDIVERIVFDLVENAIEHFTQGAGYYLDSDDKVVDIHLSINQKNELVIKVVNKAEFENSDELLEKIKTPGASEKLEKHGISRGNGIHIWQTMFNKSDYADLSYEIDDKNKTITAIFTMKNLPSQNQ